MSSLTSDDAARYSMTLMPASKHKRTHCGRKARDSSLPLLPECFASWVPPRPFKSSSLVPSDFIPTMARQDLADIDPHQFASYIAAGSCR
nr:hypothetical protein CFP56_00982 [Quercus suber]